MTFANTNTDSCRLGEKMVSERQRKKNNKNTHASNLVVVDEEISGNVTIQIVAVVFWHIMCDDKKKQTTKTGNRQF